MKKFLLTNTIVVLVAVCLSLAGINSKTASALSGGLTISPTSIDKQIAPGGSYKGEVLVINQGDDSFAYKMYASPYSVSGEEYKPYFTPVKGAVDVTKWITFDSNGSTIKPGSQNTIPVTISIPKGIGAGSYYAALFAETEDKGASGVITRKRVGTVVYIRVTGNATEKGGVDSWNVPFMQQDPFKAALKLDNTGSVHYQASVKVTVSDLFGNPKYIYERQPKVLPQKVRSLPIAWDKGAKFGLFKVTGEVNYFNNTESLPTKYVFIASPIYRFITAGILVAFVVFIVYVGKKRVVKK
ncbi:MAG TPA: hypothetical protein VLA92_04805 [Candidatus Saccharimonadales bacterium]|nr:hypothetical protein [Candidatus Saccharimonadales bacterium]